VTDTIEEDHAQVAFILLGANTNLTAVFDSKVDDPTPTPPYVLIYPTVSWPRDGVGTALDGEQVTVTTTWNCHCVGLTPEAARAVSMQVRSSLLGVRPTIAGRNCSLIKQTDAQPPARDEPLGFAVFDAVLNFGFTSTG